jgi:hypothetical protein
MKLVGAYVVLFGVEVSEPGREAAIHGREVQPPHFPHLCIPIILLLVFSMVDWDKFRLVLGESVNHTAYMCIIGWVNLIKEQAVI